MERMNGDGSPKYDATKDDPRLPLLFMGFTPTNDATDIEFYGVSGNWDRNIKVLLGTQPNEVRRMNIYDRNDPDNAFYIDDITDSAYGGSDNYVKACMWTYYNPVTYMCNDHFMYNLETLAEVELFLAEAAYKGYYGVGGGTVADHVKSAVKASYEFWYFMNRTANGTLAAKNFPYTDLAKAILQPDKETTNVDSYANTMSGTVSGNEMAVIMQQKYIHLNVIGVYELFAEIRRTRYPKLEPITIKSTSTTLTNATMMIERVPYPSSEAVNNAEAYQAVAAESNWTSPVFWNTKSKTESYFLTKAIKDP
jgi:hypothetical protein